MARRLRTVYPDTEYMLPNGDVILIVSEEALQDVMAVAVSQAMFAGGIVQMVQERAETGVPDERVTVKALVSWQDRTNAKAQPEPAVEPQVLPQAAVNASADRLEEAALRVGDEYDRLSRLDPTHPDPTPEQLEAELEARATALRVAQELEDLNAKEQAMKARGAALIEEEARAREENGDVPIPEEAVVVGAPVGYAQPNVTENVNIQQRDVPRQPRESGAGAGALPFQRGGGPGEDPGVDLSQIAHGDVSSLPRGDAIPAPGQSDAGLDDGFVPLAEEDDSSVPEQYR